MSRISDISKHSEESDIRSLTDSDRYRALSETTAPINPSMLQMLEAETVSVWICERELLCLHAAKYRLSGI